jgi:hypothetical protein
MAGCALKLAHLLLVIFFSLKQHVVHANERKEPNVVGQVDHSPMEIFLLPHGVHTSNETVRTYWNSQPVIPTARVVLVPVVTAGAYFQSLLVSSGMTVDDLYLQVRLYAGDGKELVAFVEPYILYYDFNIGAFGNFEIECVLFNGITKEILSTARKQFTIGTVLMSSLFGAVGKSDILPKAPPVTIPEEHLNEYTMNGQSRIYMSYYDDVSDQASKTYPIYTREEIDKFINKASNRDVHYYGYTDTFLYASLDAYPVIGKSVLIIGSNTPWYESICIAAGAKHCVTLEYNELRYQHPNIHTFTVANWEMGISQNIQCQMPTHPYNCKFDVIWSISSFEHDGLGRYGDPLNPSGDITAMNKLLRNIEPYHGLIHLSVPVGEDAVFWNECRIYGPIRLPQLLANFKVVNAYGLPLDAVTNPQLESIVAATNRHKRIAPLETFQPIIVLAPRHPPS